MEIKEALKYILAKMCCEENAEICKENCPLYGMEECSKITFADKDYEKEVLRTIKDYYHAMK